VEEPIAKVHHGQLISDWHDWLIAEILRREAAEFITGSAEEPSPETEAKTNTKTE